MSVEAPDAPPGEVARPFHIRWELAIATVALVALVFYPVGFNFIAMAATLVGAAATALARIWFNRSPIAKR